MILLIGTFGFGQKDSLKVKELFEQCEQYRYSDPDSSIFFANKALKISNDQDYNFGIAKSYYYLGDGYLTSSRFSEAMDYLDSAITFSAENNESIVEVDAINLKGIMYSDLGEYDKSIEYYAQGLEKAEKLKYNRGQIIAKSNTGVSHYLKGEFAKSLEFFISSLDNFMEMGDTLNYLICLGNIASTYLEIELYDESLEMLNDGLEMCKGKDEYVIPYTELLSQKAVTLNKMGNSSTAIDIYFQCIDVKKEIPDWRGIARMYNNISEIYFDQGKPNKGISYAERAMELADSLGYIRDLAFYNKTMAVCLNRAGDDARAKKYVLTSIKMSEELGAADDLKDAYALSADIFASLGDYRRAYEYQEKMVALKDSLERMASEQSLEELATLHQLDKKELENEKLKEENEKERLSGLLKDEQLAKDRNQKIFLGTGLALMLLLAIFVFRAYQNKKKSSALIEHQKEQIEEQHFKLEETYTEIKDSIEYAKNIQNAILPPPVFWDKHLNDSFVLYIPKDIVAGDFYWMEEADGKVFFAAADCTGHGVPGAMVSVVCHNALTRAVRELGLRDPGKILDKVTDLVIETFEKSDREVKDGMDIGLCAIDGKSLEYAGAHNPLWLVRKGELQGIELNMELNDLKLYEVKASKQPVGQYSHRVPFETSRLTLQENDKIYMSSDGYPDQFGGDKGKKMKTKGFKKLLLESNEMSIQEQKAHLKENFLSWRGQFEQLDDVCVIGVKI